MSENAIPAELQSVRVFGQVVSVIGCIICGLLFVCEVISTFERRDTLLNKNNRVAFYSVLFLMAVTVMGFWVQVDGAMLWWLDWTRTKEDCDNFMRPVTFVYVIMKQFMYLFLFERMKIVHNALNIQTSAVRFIRWIVFLSCTVGVAAIYFPLIIVFFEGVVIPPGICVQHSTSLVPIVLFAVSDVGLSSLMLGLFVAPLTKHAREISKLEQHSDAYKLLMEVARRNLILSSLMMSITVTILFFMVYTMHEIHSNPNPQFGYKQTLHTVFAAVDATATVVLCHFITISWVPSQIKFLVKRFFPRQEQTQPDSRNPSNPNSRKVANGTTETQRMASTGKMSDKQIIPSAGISEID